MKTASYSSLMNVLVLMGILASLLAAVTAAPMEPEDEQSENSLAGHSDADGDMTSPWDSINVAALRKLLMQLDAEDRVGMMNRVGRSWPQPEARGWGARAMDGRLVRQWRADKRQVRFRQCYFNPISCFRK